MRIILITLCLTFFLIFINGHCVHDSLLNSVEKKFYNDFTGRFLQTTPPQSGKLRIFADYSQITVGNVSSINYIRRIVNITASYFYNTIYVDRLPRLYFPQNTTRTCNVLTVPENYVNEGTIGDFGVVCGNQQNFQAPYIAKSAPCAFLTSNKRPIWGMMQWNNLQLKFTQQGFQQIVFVGIHEMTHLLGFSALMYQLYPSGNPLLQDPNGQSYLSSPRILQQMKNYFGCQTLKGMLLQDQDGSLISSHWERKTAGNQFMIATNKKDSFMSRITLALLQSTGWYLNISYQYAQPGVWGKGQGCGFLDIQNCDFGQFCNDQNFSCDWQATGIGKCRSDLFTNACDVSKYYTNTICTDEQYQLKNLNAPLNALERGGSNSRCFSSNYREIGKNANILNNRCYFSVCTFEKDLIFLLVGQYILLCSYAGQIIEAPGSLEGTLTCPQDFQRFCGKKQSCAFHCSNNGVCIDGMCLCTGSTQLTPSCLDVSLFIAPTSTTGGLQLNTLGTSSNQYISIYTQNSKCFGGTVLDPFFGQCIKCKEAYNCQNCNADGCISCDNGSVPINNMCISQTNKTSVPFS